MDTHDELSSLEDALRNARKLLKETRTRAHLASAPSMLSTLDREKIRSQRHNHYFTVVVMSSTKLGTVDLLSTAAGVFRASDLVGLLDGEGRYLVVGCCGCALEEVGGVLEHAHVPAVAAVLPETDRTAAGCALKRFESMITSDDEVRVGLAVYPDDSTDSAELLRIAAG